MASRPAINLQTKDLLQSRRILLALRNHILVGGEQVGILKSSSSVATACILLHVDGQVEQGTKLRHHGSQSAASWAGPGCLCGCSGVNRRCPPHRVCCKQVLNKRYQEADTEIQQLV